MIEHHLNDPEVTELIFTHDHRLIYEKKGQLHVLDKVWRSQNDKDEFEKIIINSLSKAPSYENPMATGLWKNFRIQVVSPPVTPEGLDLQLRRFASNVDFQVFRAQDWSEGSSNVDLVEILRKKFEERANFLIVGPTGCGKTTLLKSLLFSYCKNDRVVGLEDTPELPLVNPLSKNLRTYFSSSPDVPHVDLNDLVQTSLRLRPDRLIMGEMRGAEAASFLLMLSTGHEGSGATLHARSPLDALYRLEMLTQLNNTWSVQTVRKLIHSALDVIVVVKRTSEGRRVISEIAELAGLEEQGFLTHTVYQAPPNTGSSSDLLTTR